MKIRPITEVSACLFMKINVASFKSFLLETSSPLKAFWWQQGKHPLEYYATDSRIWTLSTASTW